MTASAEKHQKPAYISGTERFLDPRRTPELVPDAAERPVFFADLLRAVLKPDLIHRGRATYSFVVLPALANIYNTLHGAVVAAVAETVAQACSKTVAGDGELFTGESNTAYLAAAKLNDEVEVDARILRQGRRVIVTSVDFRTKKTQRILYTARLTLYIMPVAKL